MDFLPEEIDLYSTSHSTPESDLLKKIVRETNLNVLKPRMLSGHLQGNILSLFSNMMKPRRILEIGTYTGYSAICLSSGLPTDGRLDTIDINEELEKTVRAYFQEATMGSQIKYMIGNALDILPTLSDSYDLVFIDADKENYLNYYKLIFEKVNKGGFIIADNVLWSGKVVDKNIKIDKDTKALLDFNDFVQNDNRVVNTLLPIRDGLMIAQKL